MTCFTGAVQILLLSAHFHYIRTALKLVKQMKISIKSYRWPKGIIFGNLCFNV